MKHFSKKMMHQLFCVLVFFYSGTCFAQPNPGIDTSNYYSYLSPRTTIQGKNLTTNWLRLDDVVPIMREELIKAGHDGVRDRIIYKLENGQYLSLSVYSRKSDIGLLYMEGHNAFPKKSHRDILFHKDNAHVYYVECAYTHAGKLECAKIERIPANIFVFKEDCYFFQYTDNPADDKLLVTKETAIHILRQDIRRYLMKVNDPTDVAILFHASNNELLRLRYKSAK